MTKVKQWHITRVKNLKHEHPDWGYRKIGHEVNLSHQTVKRILSGYTPNVTEDSKQNDPDGLDVSVTATFSSLSTEELQQYVDARRKKEARAEKKSNVRTITIKDVYREHGTCPRCDEEIPPEKSSAIPTLINSMWFDEMADHLDICVGALCKWLFKYYYVPRWRDEDGEEDIEVRKVG